MLCVSAVFGAEKKETPAIYTKGGGLKPHKIVEYKKTDKPRPLNLHIFYPENYKEGDKLPAIVMFFGGGWLGGNANQLYPQSAYLASRGMIAICAQYRIRAYYKAQPFHCVEDGKSAMRYVRKHAAELGVDPDKLAAGGASAGGHVAAATATVKAWDCEKDDLSVSAIPNALVLFNAVYDNGPGGYGNNERDSRVKDYWQKISPLHNLDGNQPPTLVLVGDKDQHVRLEKIKEYEKTMKDNGDICKTVLYKDTGHGFFNLH